MRKFQLFTRIVISAILITISFIFFFSLFNNTEEKDDKSCFEEIIKSKKIVVAINMNFIDFYIYKGRPMGFQYEILENFAIDHKLELEIIVENNSDKAIELLLNKECDLVAMANVNSIEKSLVIDYSIPIRETKLALVKRKDINQNSQTQNEISNQNYLDNKNIYVKKGYINTKLIKDNYIANANIIEIDSLETDEIIRKVSNNELDMTICDYHVANIKSKCHNNLDIKTDINIKKNVYWQTRAGCDLLMDSLNRWIANFKESTTYENIYNRYLRTSRYICEEEKNYYSSKNQKLSNYDNLFKKYSEIIDWDWRLLASLSYQESRFNPHAISERGAFGIMQVMPFIYYHFADKNKANNTENQVYASVMLISKLYDKLPPEVTDSSSKIKYVLSAYNIGYSHLEDALNLVAKHKKDLNSWEDVSYYLSNLWKPIYYNDSVVNNGAINGQSTVHFTNAIIHRYNIYKNVISK